MVMPLPEKRRKKYTFEAVRYLWWLQMSQRFISHFPLNHFPFAVRYHFRHHLILCLTHLKIDAMPCHAMPRYIMPCLSRHWSHDELSCGKWFNSNCKLTYNNFSECYSGKTIFRFRNDRWNCLTVYSVACFGNRRPTQLTKRQQTETICNELNSKIVMMNDALKCDHQF